MPYLPDHDRVDDAEVLLGIIDRHPLATLVSHDGTRPDADLVPLLARPDEDGGIVLTGHVARENPLVDRDLQGPVLAVFTAAEHYISPSWYPGKAEHHRAVPTWNYATVHCWGDLQFHHDRRWLMAAVARLTRHQESSRPDPWRMGLAPPDHVDELLTQIVGISLHVTTMTGKFKVSSHKPEADRLGARDGVAAERSGAGSSEMVALMTDPPQLSRRPHGGLDDPFGDSDGG